MSKFIEILRLVMALLPAIIEAVKSIESALPQSGLGAEKLKLVREVIEGAFASLGDLKVRFEEVWPSIEKAVAAVVGLFNRTGLFKKS